jgi:hypothetical protein
MLPAVAGTALGHHANVQVQLTCDGTVTYQLFDWTNNDTNPKGQAEATLTVSYKVNGASTYTSLPGTISFTAANYLTAYNSGIAGTPFNVGDATSVTIVATAGTWGDGSAGGTYTPVTANRPTNCAKRSPTISTVASPTTGTVGVAIDAGDTATVTGGFGLEGQSVSFGLYASDVCSGSPVISGTKLISSGTASFSTSWIPQATGTYYWKVAYAGDSNNNAFSACGGNTEKIVIGSKAPAISTKLSATSANIGDTVHDTATISGATSTAGGTVTYTVFTSTDCTSGAIDAGTVNVTNGLVPNSNGIQFNTSGTWYWRAVYSGDADNKGATSACTDEVLGVVESSPSPTAYESIGGETAYPSASVTTSPTPYESIGGETAYPSASVTTPPTSTGSNAPGSSSGPLMAMLISLAFGSIGLLVVANQRRTMNR